MNKLIFLPQGYTMYIQGGIAYASSS